MTLFRLVRPLLAEKQGFYFCLVVLTLYRILCLLQPHLVLFYDEAYYYHWSLNPDWGYYSKPPVVAWCILFFTSLLGDTAFAIKMASPLLYSATAILVYKMAEICAGARAAQLAGWVFLTSILVGYNSLFITTDAPLLFFWAATLWAFLLSQFRADKGEPALRYWCLTGVFCGLGMLSKYTMAALPGSLLLFLLISHSGRQQLRSLGPWLAAVVAGLIFSTNIIWNIQNEFVAFRHTSEISGVSANWFHPGKLLEFGFAQFLVFGPVWMWLLIRAFWTQRGGLWTSRYAVLWFSVLPLLLVISIQALLSHAFINWAGPIYVAGSVLVGISLSQRSDKLWFRAGVLNLILLSLFYHWPLIYKNLGVEQLAGRIVQMSGKNFDRPADPYRRVLGWDRVAAQIQPLLAADDSLILASDSRKLLAVLGFYAMPGEFRLARWNSDAEHIDDYYDLRVNLRNFQSDENKHFLWVSENPPTAEMLSAFAQANFLRRVEVSVYNNMQVSVYLYRLRAFKGYP